MDEKLEMEKFYGTASLPTYGSKDKPPNPVLADPSRLRRRRTVFNYAFIILSAFFVVAYVRPLLVRVIYVNRPHPPESTMLQTSISAANKTRLVPLEAHIMSKCPDARDCLRDLVVPAMEKVVDKVNFTLSYIGSVDDDDNVQCKHGQTECLGNMLSLCAGYLYPDNVKMSLGFSTCMILSWQKIPSREMVQGCSLEHGISFEDLNACVSEGGKGMELLEESVERSEKAGVTKSCTVRVDGQKWCIRDGAEWKDCPDGHNVKDLVKAVDSRRAAS